MSGVVISQYWLAQMGHPSTIMVSTITALYDVGAVFGAIGAAVVGDKLGRKRTLMLGCGVLIIGTVLMATCFERVQMMFGRVLTGLGIGFITSGDTLSYTITECPSSHRGIVTPVYQSEISPAAQRGWQVCCQLSTMLFGLMLAYWINYGFFYQQDSAQWRFPLAFQAVFAIYCVAVTIFLPDTPRWLLRYGTSPEKGTAVLARLRRKDVDDPAVQREKNEILDAIEIESREEGTWLDLFRGAGISADKRFYLAVGIQFMQQMSGEEDFCDVLAIKGLMLRLIRNQHRHLLRSHTVSNKPWHEPAPCPPLGSASASLVSGRVLRDRKCPNLHPYPKP